MKSFYTPILLLLMCPLFLKAQEIKKLEVLNSKFRETNLSITPNGKHLYFLSMRGGQFWTVRGHDDRKGRMQYDGDIWYSTREGDSWSTPKALSNRINTSRGEDEPNISMDGQTMYYQSWRENWEHTGGPYYQAELEGTTWGYSKGLGGGINRFFQHQSKQANDRMYHDYLAGKYTEPSDYVVGTDGMAISPNGKIFVVAAYNQDFKNNNFDLFISWKNDSGEWSYPLPLTSLNTKADEISVFIAGDNKTMYFASNKKGGFGGFDIYKTTLTGGNSCTRPKNIGTPYNSSKDDYGFIVSSVDDEGYIVRDGDIYQVILKEEVEPEKTLIIDGVVIDEDKNPLFANIEFVRNADKKVLANARSNSASGEFSFSQLQTTGRYTLVAKTEDGREGKVDFSVNNSTKSPLKLEIVIANPESEPVVEEEDTTTTEEPDTGTEKAIVVERLEEDLKVGEVIRVDKLYFEADKAAIKESSYPVLDQIASVLKKRSTLSIEIGGHTNGLPNHEYCDALSKMRAENVYYYLISKGVAKDRLKYKGYGKRLPIATNDTKEGRTLNQRVEFKILDSGD